MQKKKTGAFTDFERQGWEDWFRKILEEGGGQLPESFVWKTFEGIDVQPAFAQDNRPKPWYFEKKYMEWQTGILVNAMQSIDWIRDDDADLLCLDGFFPGSEFQSGCENQQIYLLDLHTIDPKTIANWHSTRRIVNFGLDPIGLLAKRGIWQIGESSDCESFVESVQSVLKHHDGAKSVLCDARVIHLSGGNAVQELAFALAVGKAYADMLIGAGIPAERFTSTIDFCFSVDCDFFIQTSKLRIFRTLWQRVVSAYGPVKSCGSAIVAMTSGRSITASDAKTNLIRTTEQALCAVAGGCDVLVVRPFDSKIQGEDVLGSRLALDVQHILKHECKLEGSLDPLAGSWYSDAICHQLAEKAWSFFVEIERSGGVLEALKKGFIQSSVSGSADVLRNAILSGEKTIVGYNKYCDSAHSAVDYGSLVEKPWISETERTIIPFHLFSIDSNG